LPIFWAGQSGDLDTVRALLEHRPEHLFATSAVNGHTVLLQAVFFGTDRHRQVVSWLLEHVGDVLGLPADEVPAARRRLLAACNVRGGVRGSSRGRRSGVCTAAVWAFNRLSVHGTARGV